MAAEQGVGFRRGDVLLVRTGYVAAYDRLSAEERTAVASVRQWCGVAQGEEMTEWLWDHQFAAVASDSPGFECRRKSSLLLGPHYVIEELMLQCSAGRSCMAFASDSTRRLGHAHRRAVRLGAPGGSV